MRISQQEARRLKRRVAELEGLEIARRRAWIADYPGGVNIMNIHAEPVVCMAVKTARSLRHAVVVTCNGDSALQFYALPLAEAGL